MFWNIRTCFVCPSDVLSHPEWCLRFKINCPGCLQWKHNTRITGRLYLKVQTKFKSKMIKLITGINTDCWCTGQNIPHCLVSTTNSHHIFGRWKAYVSMWFGNISLISCFSTIVHLISWTCINWCLNNDIWRSVEKLLRYGAWMFRAASVLPIVSSWGKDFNGRKNRTGFWTRWGEFFFFAGEVSRFSL